MLLLLLVAQAASPPPVVPRPVPPAAGATSRPTRSSWSILQPRDAAECRLSDVPGPDDIVVCARAPAELPFPPSESDPPRPVNRDVTGAGALAAQGTPCAARSGGCQVGVDVFGAGTAAVRLVQKLIAPGSCCETPGEGTNIALLGGDVVKGVGRAFRRKPDKSGRVAIPLDDAPVSTTGRLLP